jgi:polyhydroxyalkanoate synthesis regulator phasin
MLDLMKKSIYAGIGLAVMTRERIEEAGKRIANETKMSESEGRRFVDELLKKSEETRASLEKMIQEKVDATLKKMNIPTRKEVSELENRVRKLEIIVEAQENK